MRKFLLKINKRFVLLLKNSKNKLLLGKLSFLYGPRIKIARGFGYDDFISIKMDHSTSNISIGTSVYFRMFCLMRAEENGQIIIGNNNFFNNYCSMTSLGKITIGNNNQFGEAVRFYDHNHAYKNAGTLISAQGYSIGKITIGNNCWIGSNVIILKDVTIEDNVVIGAGCIIYKSIPAGSVVVNRQDLKINQFTDN